jgi:DNA topoisomerase-1
MSKILIVVESPGKIKKIQSYLGDGYIVAASFGHIRDLVKSKDSIDVNNNFKPKYQILPDKQKVVNDLKTKQTKCSDVLIASDEDREGEFIGDSIAYVLQLKNPKRMVFHEITKPAILKAVKNHRSIDTNLVHAQQARRFLDRLTGFELSPILTKKLNAFSTAGRVQSVVVKLIVERENSIKNFSSELDYYLSGNFNIDNKIFKTKGYVMKKYQQPLEGTLYTTKNKSDIQKVMDKMKGSKFYFYHTFMKTSKANPPPPFTTSSLQQEASIRLGFPIKATMDYAQKLYEGGYITYMRTDSVTLSEDCLSQCSKYIKSNFGEKYYQYRQYENKSKNAQEAHEAIRPTDMNKEGPEDERLLRLYNLIWNRTIASQMKPAEYDITYVQIISKENIKVNNEYFEGTIKKVKFDGYLVVYNDSEEDEEKNDTIKLPPLNTQLTYESIIGHQETSKPKGRFQEANLVKKLESLSIGRPSTYASIISKIQERGYVEKKNMEGTKIKLNSLILKDNEIKESNKESKIGAEKNKLVPTENGIKVVEFLEGNFTKLMNYEFTALMEEALDDIANGKKNWINVLREFYNEFHPIVEKLMIDIKMEPTDYGRLLGQHPDRGLNIYATTTSKGNAVKMIEYTKTGKSIKNTYYASIDKPIDEITLEEAIELLRYPCVIGQYEEKDIVVCKGPYGLYIKYNEKNYPWKQMIDPTIDEAIYIISEKNKDILKKVGNKYEIRDGPYGPYILVPAKGKNGKAKFVSVPKDVDLNGLTEQNIEDIIKEGLEKKANMTKSFGGNNFKKTIKKK